MPEYSIEPELLNSPRMIRRRGTRGYGALFCQWLLMPPLTLMVLAFIAWTAHLIIVRVRGPIVPARVVERYVKNDEEDNSKLLHYLVYRYQIQGQEYSERELVDENIYQEVALGDAMRVLISPIWPGHDSVLLAPGRNVWSDVWVMGIGSFLMCATLALMAWYLFILPAKRKRLALNGVPTRGRITDKKQRVTSRSAAYYFYYEYQPEAAPAPLRGKQSVRQSDLAQVQVGDEYTVLYDPRKPNFSVIYQYGDYEAL